MKLIETLLVLFLVSRCVICDSSQEDSSEELLNALRTKAKDNYGKHAKSMADQLEEYCPGSPDKLDQGVEDLVNCYYRIDKSTTMCSAIKKDFLNCTTSIVKTMEDCMPESTKGLPTLVANSIFATVKYLCGLNGEHLFEFYNSCVYQEDKPENKQEGIDCENKVKNKFEELKGKVPSASKICGVMTELRSCFEQHVKLMCFNEVTRSTWIGAYDSALEPCNSVQKSPAEST